MVSNNKKCIMCGKTYTFCLNCSKFDSLPRWMAMFCGQKCKDVFDAISDYKANAVSKSDTKIKLAGLIKDTVFTPTVQKRISEIMAISKDEADSVSDIIAEVEKVESEAEKVNKKVVKSKKTK